MRRAALALPLLLVGCGGGGGPLELVRAEPPSGAQAAGQRAERQGGVDPDAGERIYELRPQEGATVSYSVIVRNPTSEVVSVTGVVADDDRDGAFVPERVVGGPIQVTPGDTAEVTVEGTVRGCRFGAQDVPMAGPELELRSDGGTATQELDLGIQVEVQAQGC